MYKIKQVEFKDLTKEDVDAIYDVEESCEKDPTPIWLYSQLVDEMSNDGAVNFLLYYKREIVGYAVLQHPKNAWYMSNIAIKPEHRGRGWGRMLVFKRLDYIDRHTTAEKRIYVHIAKANKLVINMYKRLGFKRNASYEYSPTVPGIEMQKLL